VQPSGLAHRQQTGGAVHSFASLLADLATICAKKIPPTDAMPAFTKITNPPQCNGGP
jgi:hypothetical protein